MSDDLSLSVGLAVLDLADLAENALRGDEMAAIDCRWSRGVDGQVARRGRAEQ